MGRAWIEEPGHCLKTDVRGRFIERRPHLHGNSFQAAERWKGASCSSCSQTIQMGIKHFLINGLDSHDSGRDAFIHGVNTRVNTPTLDQCSLLLRCR